jgi:hypothetical protein
LGLRALIEDRLPSFANNPAQRGRDPADIHHPKRGLSVDGSTECSDVPEDTSDMMQLSGKTSGSRDSTKRMKT